MELLKEIKGKKFLRIGRAADLCWITFGEKIKVKR